MLSGLHIPKEGTPEPESIDEYLKKFHHFAAPSLPYLLALLIHQSSDFPPIETSLIVIESISTLFSIAFPKTGEDTTSQQLSAKKNDAAQWASSRRWAVMGDFISKIGRLAATRNIAILLTSQMTAKIRPETGAVMHPAISGTAWDTGISTRIVVFRDWIFQDGAGSQGELVPGVRLAGITKAKGVSYEGVGKVVMFTIEQNGLREVQMDQTDIVLPVTSLKRKRGEVADSEGEEVVSDQEFGWAGEFDSLNVEAVPE